MEDKLWKFKVDVLHNSRILLGIDFVKQQEKLNDVWYDYWEITLGLVFITIAYAKYHKSQEQ